MVDILCKDGAVATSFREALRWINSVSFTFGQTATAKYTDDDNNLQSIVAVGLKTGSGLGSYQFVSVKNPFLVADVVNENPELAYLLHGEIYIWYDPETGIYRKVWADEHNREQVEEINEKITVTTYSGDIINITPGSAPFDSKNFYTKEEIDQILSEKIEEQKKEIEDLQVVAYPLTPNLILADPSSAIINKATAPLGKFKISIIRGEDEDVTKDINTSFTINGKKITSDTYTTSLSKSICTEKIFPTSVENDKAIFTLKAKYSFYPEVETSLEVLFVNPMICAPISPNATCPDDYALQNSFSKFEVLEIPDNSWTWNGSLNEQKLFFAHPASFGQVTHIYDINGLDYINDYDVYEKTKNSENYYVYVKKTVVTIDDFIQKFIFNEQ